MFIILSSESEFCEPHWIILLRIHLSSHVPVRHHAVSLPPPSITASIHASTPDAKPTCSLWITYSYARHWTYVTEVPQGCTRWRQFDEAPHACNMVREKRGWLCFSAVSLSRRCALSPTSSVSVASSVVSTVPPRWPDPFTQSFSHCSCACSLKMQDVKVQDIQSAVYEWL